MKSLLLAGMLTALGWAPTPASISAQDTPTTNQCKCPVVNEARVITATGKCRPAGFTTDVPCVSMSTPTFPDGDPKDGRCHIANVCVAPALACEFKSIKFDVTMASCARACGFTPNSPMDVRYATANQGSQTLGLSPGGTQEFSFSAPPDAQCGSPASTGSVEVKNANGIVAFEVRVQFQCGNCSAANPNGGGEGGQDG